MDCPVNNHTTNGRTYITNTTRLQLLRQQSTLQLCTPERDQTWRKGCGDGSSSSPPLEFPTEEDESVVELLRCESSPIYSSRPGSVLSKRSGTTTQNAACIYQDYWVDVERNLRFMDVQNEAAFTDWIRNEANLSLALPHIKRIMYQYTADRITNGIKWLIYEWTLASIAASIKFLFVEDFWIEATAKSPSQLQVGGTRYNMSRQEFRQRIRIIMALIEGWEFAHIQELFNFLCSSVACRNTEQANFLLKALLLAFPEATADDKLLKKQLFHSFSF